jgi:hypothetical protein
MLMFLIQFRSRTLVSENTIMVHFVLIKYSVINYYCTLLLLDS